MSPSSSSSSSASSWLSVSYRSDPLTPFLLSSTGQQVVQEHSPSHDRYGVFCDSKIVVLRCHASQLLQRLCRNQQAYQQAILQDGNGRAAQVAVTDYLVRAFTAQSLTTTTATTSGDDETARTTTTTSTSTPALPQYTLTLERLDQRAQQHQAQPFRASRRGGRRTSTANNAALLPPYLLERTDIGWTQDDQFTWYLRVNLWQPCHQDNTTSHHAKTKNGQQASLQNSRLSFDELDQAHVKAAVTRLMHEFLSTHTDVTALLQHVAVAVCQDKLRHALVAAGGVAFVAQGSILPRRSGASQAPMASPPALPFCPPPDSLALHRTLAVDMGRLRPFVDLAGTTTTTTTSAATNNDNDAAMDTSSTDTSSNTTLTLEGLFIPAGITLICGGGYHGKSTLLRCIAAGVYNKIPGDGREYSVTRTDALSVRAEDGRYVQNCNISAFISNLPSLPGTQATVDTHHFSTQEASGSTSQAANVVEALELGCKVMLVDEDVSAANFMARDGRMRALVMDESITPLLYRVNGLYKTHGVSSIVVVGGVGDWLDVPHHVLLMDKYRCKDATAKAQSVSKQFSHGHVQYAGRGVVHRLPWDSTGTPIPRRPTDVFCKAHDFSNRHVALLDGGHGLALYRAANNSSKADDDSSMDDDDNKEEEEDPWIDMSRCEQLLGRKPQLYGCGLAALALFHLAREHPLKGLAALLQEWDALVDKHGLFAQLEGNDATWETTVATLGIALRPRALEVGQAVCRLRGVKFEELPVVDDGAEAAARVEEERKKKELLEMWNNRRKKANES